MKTLEQEQAFRLYLIEDEFTKRVRIYKKYSLRKYALDLGVEASSLSKYLRSMRSISDETFSRVVKSLEIPSNLLADKKEEYLRRTSNLKLLGQEHNEIKSSWHYYAILQCLDLDDVEYTSEWIANRLGLKEDLAIESIEKLIKWKAITVNDGVWTNTFENLTFVTSEDMDDTMGREFQSQLLDLAQTSIYTLNGKEKSHTSMMVAGDIEMLSTVKEKIRDFRRELAFFIFENSKNKNSIFNLQINFHPILKNLTKENSHE